MGTIVKDLTKGCCECKCGKEEVKKKIVFIRMICSNGQTMSASNIPKHYENVDLIYTNKQGVSIIEAYDDDKDGITYLGHWNDGIV